MMHKIYETRTYLIWRNFILYKFLYRALLFAMKKNVRNKKYILTLSIVFLPKSRIALALVNPPTFEI